MFAVAEYVIRLSVDSDSGHDKATCLQSLGQPCQTLEYVQRHLKSVANECVVIEICVPQIKLVILQIFLSQRAKIKHSATHHTLDITFLNTHFAGKSYILLKWYNSCLFPNYSVSDTELAHV